MKTFEKNILCRSPILGEQVGCKKVKKCGACLEEFWNIENCSEKDWREDVGEKVEPGGVAHPGPCTSQSFHLLHFIIHYCR